MTVQEVKETRKAFGMNQTEFAKLCGVSISYIKKMESNVEPITDRIKEQVARLRSIIL